MLESAQNVLGSLEGVVYKLHCDRAAKTRRGLVGYDAVEMRIHKKRGVRIIWGLLAIPGRS